MASRTFLLLGLLLAIVVLITSEVSAIDLAENHEKETKEAVGEFDAKHPDGRGGYNRGHGGGRGGGRYGGGRGGGGHYGGGGGGGRRGRSCYHGCCRRGSYGCVRCCSYAGEAVEADQP